METKFGTKKKKTTQTRKKNGKKKKEKQKEERSGKRYRERREKSASWSHLQASQHPFAWTTGPFEQFESKSPHSTAMRT